MENNDIVQFEDYFQLNHQISIHIEEKALLTELPDYDEFESQIPEVFKMATEMKGVEQNMLRPLRQLGDVVEPLANYLKAQSKKIDLMMSYILKQQHQDHGEFKTKSYGGGGFVFETSVQFQPTNYLQCKMFFAEDATAVFCFGEIISHEKTENGTEYKVKFCRIREDDREVVVRATLHQQSKQLLKNKNN